MKITPARRLKGRVRIPGDKSISHRAAIIGALASGTSRIKNFSPSADCAATLSCLKRLGVSVQTEGKDLLVNSSGGLSPPKVELYCGNSGSTMRMLTGVLAGQNFSSTLTGDASLLSRPMQRIIEPLERMGAKVKSRDGRPPLTVVGNEALRPIRYVLPVASAQVKSCVLLAGLHAEGRTEIIESRGKTRDHTERMLQWFGVPLRPEMIDGQAAVAISIDRRARLSARDISIPGDISSAAFLIAAAALLPHSDLKIEDVGLNPTRTKFLSILHSFGLQIDVTEEREKCNEPLGKISVKGTRNGQMTQARDWHLVQGGFVAEVIDELPLLAVVGTQLSGGIEIRDAGELRHKESDRIGATVKSLQAMGAEVEEFADGLRVSGATQLRGAKLDSFGDHRIAMAFTVAALLAEGDSELLGEECVGVSFPEFFSVLESVVER